MLHLLSFLVSKCVLFQSPIDNVVSNIAALPLHSFLWSFSLSAFVKHHLLTWLPISARTAHMSERTGVWDVSNSALANHDYTGMWKLTLLCAFVQLFGTTAVKYIAYCAAFHCMSLQCSALCCIALHRLPQELSFLHFLFIRSLSFLPSSSRAVFHQLAA